MVSPSAKRLAVEHLKDQKSCSERNACKLIGISRNVARYQFRLKPDEQELIELIQSLASKHKRYGYKRITRLVRREGKLVNKKRIERIWYEQGLSLCRRKVKKRKYGTTNFTINKAERKNHVWTYDFVSDRTEKGRKLKFLCVVDEYTRECLAIRVEPSICSAQVLDTLEWLFLIRGVPDYIRSDNGPEFIAHDLCNWLTDKACATIFITPGSPWENAYIESFNGKFRDECLNCELFANGRQAQIIAENWRVEYNTYRPHSSLGYMTPEEFADNSGNCVRPTVSLHSQNGNYNQRITEKITKF